MLCSVELAVAREETRRHQLIATIPVSSGSIELRADGSFREWTIMNAGPAGNGKLGIVDDAFMAVKVGSEDAKVVRTHLPASLGGVAAGVESIEFAGSCEWIWYQ